MAETTVALFLAVYFSLVAVFYLLRLNMTPSQKIFNGKRFTVEWVGQWTFKCFQWVIWAICVIRVFDDRIDAGLFMLGPLNSPLVNLVGLVMLLVGTVGVVVSHFALGASWRSGVDPHAQPSLVKMGVYGYSRNPIFMSVMLCQLGFFLLLPSIFSLVCLLLGCFFIVRQVSVEERFLLRCFGTDYQQYQAKTPRWL